MRDSKPSSPSMIRSTRHSVGLRDGAVRSREAGCARKRAERVAMPFCSKECCRARSAYVRALCAERRHRGADHPCVA